MSPVATWSSEWHMPEAASFTWISPGRGASETRSTTSNVPGASRMNAPRVSTGTGDLLLALVVEGRSAACAGTHGRPARYDPAHSGESGVQRWRPPGAPRANYGET